MKAIVNTNVLPWLLITKTTGEKVYYSSNGKSNVDIYHELKKSLPNNG